MDLDFIIWVNQSIIFFKNIYGEKLENAHNIFKKNIGEVCSRLQARKGSRHKSLMLL